MRNRSVISKVGYLAALLAVFVAFGCQKAQLAEYRKYANDADVPRISVEEAKKDVDAGIAVIVDSRAEAAYKQEHIAGAINIPIGVKLFGSGEDKFAGLPKDKKIIVYCSCGAEHTSASLAFQMNEKKIANTYALVGGTKAWHDAGYPMGKSE